MSRFFVTPLQVSGELIKITGTDVTHIKNVLRYGIGEIIYICDGNAVEYITEIIEIAGDSVTCLVKEVLGVATELETQITLFQGIPKGDKMELIIQKTVELGVYEIVPVLMERVIVKFDEKKDIDKKLERWNRISMEAAKQCRRGIIPTVLKPMKLNEALAYSCGQLLMPYENEVNTTLKSQLSGKNKKISILIGPEGGISQIEAKDAVSKGFIPITLGARILRTETAGMAVIAAISLMG